MRIDTFTTEVLIRPRVVPPDDGMQWAVTCTCGFAHDFASYRSAYETAARHHTGHYGSEPRDQWPGGPVALGGVVAILPDAGDYVIWATRQLWLAFQMACHTWADEEMRLRDPELWEVFLDEEEAIDVHRRAIVRAYRAAWDAVRGSW